MIYEQNLDRDELFYQESCQSINTAVYRLLYLERETGLEPATFALARQRSTN